MAQPQRLPVLPLLLLLLILVDCNDSVVADASAEHEQDTSSDTSDVPVTTAPELTPQERAAQLLYDKAMEILNDSKPDRGSAYDSLLEAAQLGHVSSQELVARAYLFGDDLPLNLKKSAEMFKRLAGQGNPYAQVVSFT